MGIKYCDEIMEKINNGFCISPDAFKIGEAAILGMLYEVSSSPSPGLISPYSSGSHSDMNFYTFLNSTSSIAHAMYICAQIGIDYEDEILEKIRSVGLWAEKNMLRATDGINTQRGLLFLAGVTAAAAGMCIRNRYRVTRFNISKMASIICYGLVERELKTLSNSKKLTNGERLFLEYGLTGVRGEIEKGLPSIIEVGLPCYEEAISFGLSTPKALSHSLIGLMTVVEDTTVVNRCGIEGLNKMREMAIKALKLGGMKTLEGEGYINKMEDVFVAHNISPGGAADLLAVTVMIHELEKHFRKDE
ncbi:triphosphoribosyl-dephospho-CoA synthase [Fervidicella metallireducens AeB]|uniref:triphosphoribosyl-dephospho-CoA synthase n=1 Tax=Fervidicella metallireducens AeB TaxID=1403537 RepID=A0A017RYH7_9CLOT|nr:triphosphoribosyl-dephospho-CoA synthase [Fervidicella metallireducens]EYE88985.1 triphosphoribosyl-dephospho-CoA synthase [Fervidicella metallireducens AeB]